MTDDLLGLSLAPGDEHYRAYVGPPADYDLVSAMTFGLLTACGLRQHHTLLDVGCGSLRLGRLLIPYLNPAKYIGLEPNKWLIDDGLRYEVGASLADIRQPQFIYDTSLASLSPETRIDYAVAQSIFSHTAPDRERGSSKRSHHKSPASCRQRAFCWPRLFPGRATSQARAGSTPSAWSTVLKAWRRWRRSTAWRSRYSTGFTPGRYGVPFTSQDSTRVS